MSSKQIFRTGLMAASGLAMMGLTACASGHSSTRYGGYDYESGKNCGAACVAPAPVSVYTPPPAMPVSPGPVYVDCTQIGSCGGTTVAQPTTVYTAPSTTYTAPSTSTTYSTTTTSSYSGEMADCPAGTTLQADGTCMQSSSSSYSSYSSSSTSSYTPSTSYSTTTSTSCPAGTTMQADGTCMQGSVEIYTAPSTSYGYQSTGTTTDYRPIRK